MIDIHTEDYRLALEAMLKREAQCTVELMIVPDIADWAIKRGGNGRANPMAMAVTDNVTGQWGILLRSYIAGSSVDSVLDRMELFGGFEHCRSTLSTPERFIRHTVLHELAHLVNNWDQEHEDDCDRWAFDRLQKEP